ncbi:MAG TPA: AbrB/MazE/SpoVT family DNA-binding domain-containing protein [Clostridia bacterium]|nr:AbrB/MazE/SpoVT family DNA-binding domain-containing protein [Clostridia bacterium]
MLPVRKRIEPDGKVSIGEMLKAANLRPGDPVEIAGGRNKIVIKPLVQKRPKAWLDRSPANGRTAATSSRICWLLGRTRMTSSERTPADYERYTRHAQNRTTSDIGGVKRAFYAVSPGPEFLRGTALPSSP